MNTPTTGVQRSYSHDAWEVPAEYLCYVKILKISEVIGSILTGVTLCYWIFVIASDANIANFVYLWNAGSAIMWKEAHFITRLNRKKRLVHWRMGSVVPFILLISAIFFELSLIDVHPRRHVTEFIDFFWEELWSHRTFIL